MVVRRFVEVISLWGEEWFWDGKGKRWGVREMAMDEAVSGDGGGPNVMKQRECVCVCVLTMAFDAPQGYHLMYKKMRIA